MKFWKIKNLAEDLITHELCCHIDETCTGYIYLLLSKKCNNFSDSLTIGINILICLFSNSILIFSNELWKFCFTREHLFSIRQKFQLKIYNAFVSILKISTNNNLLRVYCHLKDGHLRKSNTENCQYLKDFQAKVFIFGIHLGLLIYSRHIILLERT